MRFFSAFNASLILMKICRIPGKKPVFFSTIYVQTEYTSDRTHVRSRKRMKSEEKRGARKKVLNEVK